MDNEVLNLTRESRLTKICYFTYCLLFTAGSSDFSDDKTLCLVGAYSRLINMHIHTCILGVSYE